MKVAEVYRTVDGEKVERFVARHKDVDTVLHGLAEEAAFNAELILGPHFRTGRAHIELHKGDIDYHVELVDPNALAIEFGHKAYTYTRKRDGKRINVGASKGIGALRGAIGMQL